MNFLIISALVASFLFLPAFTLSVEIQGRQERRTTDTSACGYATVPLLRAYNAAATDHFYTTDAVEMENAIISNGYTSEGDAAEVLPSQAPNTIPLYRAWSKGGSDHFYTTSAVELQNALQNDGYKPEGITAYVYPSALCGTVPLYRVYNAVVTDHFYTTNETERNNAIANDGYVDEGIAAYVSPTNATIAVNAVTDDIIAVLNVTLVS